MADSFLKSVAVLGLGYVGLTLVEAASQHFRVVGYDADGDVVAGLDSDISHIQDIDDVQVSEMIEKGYRATHSLSDLAEASTYVIYVPTPLSKTGGRISALSRRQLR